MRQITSLGSITLGVVVTYFLATCSVVFLFNPLQSVVTPQLGDWVSLAYIPHGVRVFAFVLYGRAAIPGLIIGEFVSGSTLTDVTDPPLLLLLSIVSTISCWLVFAMLGAIGINSYYLTLSASLPKGKYLIITGVLTSFVNAFLLTAILESQRDIISVTYLMAGFMIGDFVGFLVIILLAKLTLEGIGSTKD